MRIPTRILTLSCLACATCVAPSVLAASAPAAAFVSNAIDDEATAAANLNRLTQPITIEFKDTTLDEVIKFITEFSGAEIEPIWADDTTSGEGLDKEFRINIRARRITVLSLLERVLTQAQSDLTENTWQFTTYGSIEIGPKSQLNKHTSRVMYDINDMLFEIPNYRDAPNIDLDSVLDQGEGGGGTPFNDADGDDDNEERLTKEEKTERIVDLITMFVEPDQWQDNGGEGGSIQAFRGTLIVQAPDYMHRQINGYRFWTRHKYGVNKTTKKWTRHVTFNANTQWARPQDLGVYDVNTPRVGALPAAPASDETKEQVESK